MKLEVKKSSVDVTLYVFIQDSASAVGAGKAGLLFNSAGLVAYYVRPLGSATAITLVTQTVTGAHTDGGFVEVSAANMPGLYRLDLPDAVVATGVGSVAAMLHGAAGMAPLVLELQLVDNVEKDVFDRLGAPAGASIAADIDAAPTAIENADALLKRDWTGLTGEASRSALNALRSIRNKWSISGTTVTFTKEDDTTAAYTAALTEAVGANPYSASDPT